MAGLVKFLVDDPQSTTAWARGSEGERILAAALTRRVGDRAVLLHDRQMPGSSANIDHLAIAASGVWIIDAKKYQGRLQRRDQGGWRTSDYRVYVNGRDQTRLTGGLHKQAAVVRTALPSRWHSSVPYRRTSLAKWIDAEVFTRVRAPTPEAFLAAGAVTL